LRNRSTPPNPSQAEDPGTLELRAAALEAIGDDRRAAESYARRIVHDVRSLKSDAHPDPIARVRDWSVGRAYAQCVVRAGQAEATIASLQAASSRPRPGTAGHLDERGARVLLALLLDARDHHDRP